MHLPQHILAPMVKLYISDASLAAVLQALHKEDFHFHQREIGSHYLSQLVLVESHEVDAVSHVVSCLDDVQKLRRDEVLRFESLHSPL